MFNIQNYKMFNENIKFVKQKKKNKDAKTDTFNVVKNDFVIGLVKWSSRLRGYGFVPTPDCNDDIKEFVKSLMSERRKKN